MVVYNTCIIVSADENGVIVSADIMDSSSTESHDEEFIKERATSTNGGKNCDSGGNRKWSEKFGTLEDFYRSFWRQKMITRVTQYIALRMHAVKLLSLQARSPFGTTLF